MADKEVKNSSSHLLDGPYKATGSWYSSMVVDGNTAVMKTPNGVSQDVSLKLGDFGEAHPEIKKATGQKFYNIEFSYTIGAGIVEPGVVGEDGRKITTKGMMG